MTRRLPLWLLLCCSSLALAQNTVPQSDLAPQQLTRPVQVVYVVDGASIVTYDVAPQFLYATQAGTPLNLSGTFYWLVHSPNDHFLYVITYDTNDKKHLFVYATDASDLQIDPKANFAYLVYGLPSGLYNTFYEIQRFAANPSTGQISQPQIEAKYRLSNGAEGTTYCGLAIGASMLRGSKTL